MIELPWPPAKLSPNARGHWKSKETSRKKYKSDCFYLAKNYKKPTGAHLILRFCPPDKRKRDADNMLASCKNGIDGACRAWGIDDSMFRKITIIIDEPIKGGKVIVSFE